MGFDKDDTRPLLHPERRTTKVNFGMAAAILVFFAVAGVVIWLVRAHFSG